MVPKCLYRGVVVVILVINPTRQFQQAANMTACYRTDGSENQLQAWRPMQYLASERHKRGCEVGRQCGSMHPDTIRPGVTKPAGWNQVFHFSRRGIGPSSQNEFPRSVKHMPYPLEGGNAALLRVL